MKKISLLLIFLLVNAGVLLAQKTPQFKVIALYENGGHHIDYSKAAVLWLDKLAAAENFTIDYIQNTDQIDSAFLSRYQLFIQLDYPPYAWKDKAVKLSKTTLIAAKGDGSDFIMLPYWANLTVITSGHGFTNLWARSSLKTTSPNLPGAR
jgi:hypothetical protein